MEQAERANEGKSNTTFGQTGFVCVCAVLEMLGLSGDECAVFHLCPVADR